MGEIFVKKILLHGFNENRLQEISSVLKSLDFFKYSILLKETDLNQKVGYLIQSNGYSYEERKPYEKDISNIEFIFFAGFSREEIFSFIDYMKEKQINRPVLSMLTPVNIEWITGHLIYEVNEEHLQMTKEHRKEV